ncbi:Transcription elongation factor S-II like protein [Verticillium longisporum]|nr:Transcription elongation factor S-II like protein [Verticillium longisporum]
MSLRLRAMQLQAESMASSLDTDTDQQTARQPTREYLLADMAGRSPQENPVCTPCFLTLRSVDHPHVRLSSAAECRLCAVSAGKPEAYTKPFCDFLTENPTIFHTVAHFKTKLADAGFKELPARANWAGKLEPGGKYWTTRNGSALIAFTVGQKYEPGNGRTGDTTRDNCLGLLYNGLAYRSTQPPDAVVARAVECEAAAHRHYKGVTDDYKKKIKSLFSNLKVKTNRELGRNVMDGKITADRFVTMTQDELKSAEQRKRENELQEENMKKAQVPMAEKSISDALKCGKCGQKKVSYTQAQTRSADEPMTTFCECTFS